MNRRQKIIVSVTGIFLVLLLLVGLTYAYFLTRITGNTNTKSISVKTANLALVYGDGNGILEVGEVLVPGDTVKFKTASGDTVDKKTFSVTNEGNATTDYVVVIDNVSVTYTSTVEVDGVTHTAGSATTFESNDFVYTLTCTSGCNGVDTQTIFPIEGGILVGNSIDVDEEQTYELSMTYLETGENQSNDMNKTLTARVNIKDISTLNPYSSNTGTLAYNIINNAIVGATGTTLAGVPETDVAVSITGSKGTGKSELATDFPGWEGLTYGDTQADADNGANEVSGSTDAEICNSVKGKYLSDAYNWYYDGSQIGKVMDCDTDGTPYLEIQDYENVLSVTQDDLGTSYYYRGAVEDNYVNFNNMCWRIVRIEGDGSIKIVLEDQDSTCATANGNWDIGTGHYGYNQTKVTNSSGQESTGNKYIADYVSSPTNTDTSMRAKFDAWLTSASIDTSKLKKDNWCLGNTTDPYNNSGVLQTSLTTDLMYSNTSFYYDTYRRLYGKGVTANASLRCDGKNYETHESYIGALTADEVVFAGGKAGSANSNYYLLNDYQVEQQIWWWTLSPSNFDYGDDCAFDVGYGGNVYLGSIVINDYGSLRPAVSLASSTPITGGNGTQTNPYVVG